MVHAYGRPFLLGPRAPPRGAPSQTMLAAGRGRHHSNGSRSVRIIHGKGTGVLRAAVHAELKKIKYVKRFRLGVYGEGEDGVTIVEFA